ncbi:MAG: DUF2491 family protein [Endozoicomonas sp.]
MIFDLFRKKEAKASLPSPLNLRLGAAVELDLLPYQMISEQLRFPLPEGAQTIEAAGFIDLGGGAALCRFYTADDGFIQVSSTGGYDSQNINDIKLLAFEQTHHIASQQGVDQWVSDSGAIGRSEFLLNDTVYKRVWDADVPGKIEAVKLTESVYNKDSSSEPYDVDHLAMLYQRNIPGSDRYEYLLASLEFTDENEATAVLSLGIDLNVTSMTIM